MFWKMLRMLWIFKLPLTSRQNNKKIPSYVKKNVSAPVKIEHLRQPLFPVNSTKLTSSEKMINIVLKIGIKFYLETSSHLSSNFYNNMGTFSNTIKLTSFLWKQPSLLHISWRVSTICKPNSKCHNFSHKHLIHTRFVSPKMHCKQNTLAYSRYFTCHRYL
jgi:hypothetical protein